MTDRPGTADPGSHPGPVPAASGPPAGPPVVRSAPAPVFGWYIPAGPPETVASAGNGPPAGYALSPAYAPAYGYPSRPGYAVSGFAPQGYAPPYPPAPYGHWYPPGQAWGPVRKPSFARVPHPEPQPYLRLMRTANYRWWRPVLGLLAFLGCYFVAAVLVLLVAVAAGMDLDPLRLEDLTDPAVLALTNVSLIVAIPSVWVAWAVHTERIGWASSVLGRIRWRLMWRYGLIGLAVLGVSTLLGLAFSSDLVTTSGFDANSYGLLILVVLFSTPLQSAAEEYVFRGYLSQAISSWIPSLTTGAVLTGLITATLFSLIHIPGDFLTFFDRFAFGLAASAAVWLTGGLEAAIALHAANNVWVFLVYGALGDSPSSDIQGDPGTAALLVAVDVLVMSLYVWIVARTRKRWHPETLSRAADRSTAMLPLAPPGPAPPPGWGAAGPGWGGQPPYGPAPYAPTSSSGP